jgi:putative peptide zinc metalloprotease protein
MSEAPVRLRPELCFSPTRSHDTVSYIVEDNINQKYWKIGELEYEVCSAIDGSRSIPETMQQLMMRSPLAAAAGAEKVHKIIMWLVQMGLVETSVPLHHTELPPEKPGAGAKPSKLFDPSFFRIPVLSADVIEKYSRPITWLVSYPCLIAAVIAWCIALGMVYQNNQDLMSLGEKLFVPGSQWWWLLAWFILKAVHELGHAVACTRVGIRTNGAGIGMMFFAPSPYVDVTNLWASNKKWSRMLVSAAGMLFELTLSAIAIIGACTFENPSIQYLCFSIATLGTFTTLAFNGNPLMRYDGYYIAIDMIGRPNLWQDASLLMKTYFATWIYKNRKLHSVSFTLLAYGIASWISRMLMLATMGWGVWRTWDGLGLVVVAFFACLWFIIPPIMKILARASQPNAWSWRGALAEVCPHKAFRLACGVVALLLCSFLPSPIQVYWPAIVDYVDPSDVRTIAPGFVDEMLVHDGQGVRSGDVIVRLSNPELELEFQAAQAQLKSSDEKCVALRAQRKHSELQTEEAIYESLLIKCNLLKAKVESLHIKAPRDGVLISRMSQNLPGSFLPEGQSVGIIADPVKVEVRASVPQDAWDIVSHNVHAPVSVYLESGVRCSGKVLLTLPRTSDTLESPSLGGLYGGPIPVMMSQTPEGEDRLTTNSPRLQTRIELDPSVLRNQIPPPGLHCSIRLTNEHEAVWQTAYRWLNAAVQSRFNVPS